MTKLSVSHGEKSSLFCQYKKSKIPIYALDFLEFSSLSTNTKVVKWMKGMMAKKRKKGKLANHKLKDRLILKCLQNFGGSLGNRGPDSTNKNNFSSKLSTSY